jgi:anti-sigma B factor antagonist
MRLVKSRGLILHGTVRRLGRPDRIGEKTVDLTLATQEVEGATIVAVGGEIDVYTAPRLRDKITELVADGVYNLIIDMEGVEFLDSTGLGGLVGGLKKVRAHDGSLRLICTQERLLKIFRITGLAKVFTIHDSAAAAVAG